MRIRSGSWALTPCVVPVGSRWSASAGVAAPGSAPRRGVVDVPAAGVAARRRRPPGPRWPAVDGAAAPTFGEAPAATAARSKNMTRSKSGGEPFGHRLPGLEPSVVGRGDDGVGGLLGLARAATRVTPRTLRRRDIRRATADWEVVQPLSSSAGAWMAPRVAPPPPTLGAGRAAQRLAGGRRRAAPWRGRPACAPSRSASSRGRVTVATRWSASALKSAKDCSAAALACVACASCGHAGELGLAILDRVAGEDVGAPSPRRRTRARPSTTYAPNGAATCGRGSGRGDGGLRRSALLAREEVDGLHAVT